MQSQIFQRVANRKAVVEITCRGKGQLWNDSYERMLNNSPVFIRGSNSLFRTLQYVVLQQFRPHLYCVSSISRHALRLAVHGECPERWSGGAGKPEHVADRR
jgi:hypothetical protein